MQLGPFDFRSVTDAVDIQHTRKAAADTLDHIGDQFTRQPVQRLALPVLGLACHFDDVPLQRDLDSTREFRAKLSLWSLRADSMVFQGDFDSRRN
jgi:hypothetical protein